MIVFIILYFGLLLQFFGKKQQFLSQKKTKLLQGVHLISFLLVIAIIWMKYYGMSFRGYWTERVIWNTFYFTALGIFVSGNRDLVKGFQKYYGFLLLFFPIVLCAFLVIPFVGLSLLVFCNDEFIGDASMVRYSDRKFRIELPAPGILASVPEHGTLIVKKGLFEYEDQVLSSINDTKVSVYRIEIKSPKEILVRTLGKNEKKYDVENFKIDLKHPVHR